mmetsp:Transcript_25801/g.76207  ORF Transcript_25801/g.76207 Transcript_25801/m.76207 type:complete len:201 (-) Transcript_25801:385-987(-)
MAFTAASYECLSMRVRMTTGWRRRTLSVTLASSTASRNSSRYPSPCTSSMSLTASPRSLLPPSSDRTTSNRRSFPFPLSLSTRSRMHLTLPGLSTTNLASYPPSLGNSSVRTSSPPNAFHPATAAAAPAIAANPSFSGGRTFRPSPTATDAAAKDPIEALILVEDHPTRPPPSSSSSPSFLATGAAAAEASSLSSSSAAR